MDTALNLRITKRQSNGSYIQGRLLSGNLGPPTAPWPRATTSAVGGVATATILSLGSRLYAATET